MQKLPNSVFATSGLVACSLATLYSVFWFSNVGRYDSTIDDFIVKLVGYHYQEQKKYALSVCVCVVKTGCVWCVCTSASANDE